MRSFCPPLGMEYSASWSIDSIKKNTVKGFCCLNATARGFAKFGKLYLNNGNYKGKQLIPKKWIEQSLNHEVARKNNNQYSYQWWRFKDYIEINEEDISGEDLIINGLNKKKYKCVLRKEHFA